MNDHAASPQHRGEDETTVPVEQLAERLSELARELEDEDSLQATLDAIVRAAVGTVPGADHASISAIKGRREVETLASTDDLARAIDRAQYETGEGPCLDTLYEERTERLPDVRADTRWPHFTARAAEHGLGSMLAMRLYVHGDDLGALNLHGDVPHGFGQDGEEVGLLFAAHAAVAMAGAEEVEQLRAAVSARDLIGQAKGILMERHRLTADQAFRLLVRASQSTNQRLRQVAEQLVFSGELPRRE